MYATTSQPKDHPEKDESYTLHKTKIHRETTVVNKTRK